MKVRVDAQVDIPVCVLPLLDAGDFKTIEDALVFNQAGMDLVWNFIDFNGNFSQTAVTPANAGNYLWTNKGNGIYTVRVPASGGASINNDTEGHGWFSGVMTGVLPFRGPIVQFEPDALADIEDGSASVGVPQTGDAYELLGAAVDAADGIKRIAGVDLTVGGTGGQGVGGTS